MDPSTTTGRIVLVFLTTSCRPCLALWNGAAAAAHPGLYVVTPSASTENRRRAAALGGMNAKVIMASEVWHRYRVTGAPWLVVVDDGMVTMDAAAPHSWAELIGTIG